MSVRLVPVAVWWTVSASVVFVVVKWIASARVVLAVASLIAFVRLAPVVGWLTVFAHRFAIVAEIINLTANARRKDRSFRKVFVFVAVRLLANARRRLPTKVPDAPTVMDGNTFADV